MSDAQVISQEKKEEARTKFNAVYDLTLQMARFGPYLALRMSLYSIRALPWGIGSAGAESVKEGVDSGNEDGVAKLTASMVRLGLLGTVHDIVVSLCAQERADTVAKVTAALLTQQEVAVVVQITNALVASGHVKDAVAIGNELISHGNTQIYEVLKDSDFDLGLLASGGKKKGVDGVLHKGSEVLDNLKAGGAELLNRVTPQGDEDESEKDHEVKTDEKRGT